MCADLVASNQTGFKDEFVNPPQSAPPLPSDIQPKSLAATIDSYPDELRAKALHRITYIRWIEEHLVGGWTEKNLKPLLAEASSILPSPVPNWRTLARWHKVYIQYGKKLISLIPRYQEKGNSQSRLSASDEEYFEQAVQTYLVREQPSIAYAYQLYCDTIQLKNITIVENPIKTLSYSGFKNRVKKLPAYQVMKCRKSSYMANVEFQAIGTHKPTSRLLERVEIDHTPLDVILLDDSSPVAIGRPTLTLLMDAYSHCVVGFYIGFKQPGYEPVRNALLNTIYPKDFIKNKYPAIEHEWPCYGKPETLVVDNGVEFWSNSLEQACLELGINIQYNPVRKPWLKPIVERFFGTINRKLLVSMPGKTFSNILIKAKYDPHKDAVIKFSTFLDIFHRWIIDVYHYESDSRHRFIPINLWSKGYKYAPPATIVGNDLPKLDVILSISLKCIHRRGGIQRYNLHYDSIELASYRKNYPDYSNGNKIVKVKLNPRDVSYAYVFIEEINEYIRVPCLEYTSRISLLEHSISSKLLRFLTDTKMNKVSLAKARIYIHDRIESEISENKNEDKKSRKKRSVSGFNKIAKFRDIGSHPDMDIVPEHHLSEDKVETPKSPQINQSQFDDWDSFISGLEPYK